MDIIKRVNGRLMDNGVTQFMGWSPMALPLKRCDIDRWLGSNELRLCWRDSSGERKAFWLETRIEDLDRPFAHREFQEYI